jgi:glycosyltransferase involved in cell wall biosynthesis
LFYPCVPYASYKNHELIIRALFELKNLNPNLFSRIKVIFTSKPTLNMLTKYYNNLSLKLKVSNQIVWTGYLDESEMEDYYLNSDIFIFPSKLESFGLPLIEAAVRNKRVFTLDNSFSHELLDDYSGVCFLKNEPKIWAKEIKKFYKKDISKNRITEQFRVNFEDKSITKLLMEN